MKEWKRGCGSCPAMSLMEGVTIDFTFENSFPVSDWFTFGTITHITTHAPAALFFVLCSAFQQL